MHARSRHVPPRPSSSPPRGATCARWVAALSLLVAVGSARAQTCADPVPVPPKPVHGSTGMGQTGLSEHCKMFDRTGSAFVFRMNLDGWGRARSGFAIARQASIG
ncbi:MAG: hypothetical protein EOP90_10430 [Lysobacteraceae bacterium]|nr:MAG: hypothetical protein EOP90_10430 [Xanthomonadaceae bacterium]